MGGLTVAIEAGVAENIILWVQSGLAQDRAARLGATPVSPARTASMTRGAPSGFRRPLAAFPLLP